MLSCGHSCLTLYDQLYLSGYGLTLDDLAHLRQWGSLTPAHPEVDHTPGVETTTGPLGQGVGNAVGMAMAARRERGLLDPDAAPGTSPFDHTIWCFASDGDLEEGVSAEASSLAGTQQLGNLVLLWDDNHISIEDDTAIAFGEDTVARYEAYGWHVQRVDWLGDDGSYSEDVQALHAALVAARAETSRPSFIALRTIIGWPAPTKQNTFKAHGSALGAEEVAEDQGAARARPGRDLRRAAGRARARPPGRRPRPRAARRVAAGVRRLGRRQPRGQGAARPPDRAPAADRLAGRPPDVPRRRRRASRPARPAVRSSTRSRPCCRSCGAARPTSRRATTRA